MRRAVGSAAEFEAAVEALAGEHADVLGWSGWEEAHGVAGPLRRATLAGNGRVIDVYLYADGGAGLRIDWRWLAYNLVDYSSAAMLFDDAWDALAAAVDSLLRAR